MPGIKSVIVIYSYWDITFSVSALLSSFLLLLVIQQHI